MAMVFKNTPVEGEKVWEVERFLLTATGWGKQVPLALAFARLSE